MRSREARLAGRVAVAVIALCLLAGPAGAQATRIDSEIFGGLEARSIGPAAMSGRVAAVDGVAGDRLILYVGTAGGGLWKSVDGGLKFKPVFDKYNQSIGAVAVDPADPKTVWVGTGESWVRNSVSVGDGIYRSTDAGDTWTKMGLADSERIARIVVNPKDSRTVFACATGHLFDDSAERGVFRTKDAGKTWEKVLYVAPDTGCADLAMDSQDPNILYAGMWQFRRRPDFFTSGGPKSGFFRSVDGGATWQPMKKGLPSGDLGRIAIAVAPSKPTVVYAAVESAKTALFRSEDRGQTWTEVNSSRAVTERPFYFARLVADPNDPDRVYKMGGTIAISEDGGKTFSPLGGSNVLGPTYHSDVHDLWIDPRHGDDLVIGTDGGVYISHDRGNTWRFVGSLPVGQFYHVSYDMDWPYNVYGGLQDNSSWYGPSRRSGGILNKHWQSLTGGDGFWAFADPTDPDIIYDEYQGGNLFRIRRSTLESKDIKPTPGDGEPKYRFNWNTPIHLSPTRPGTLYYGAQFLFRSTDRGESWERISPDLTTNDPAKQKQDDSGGLTLDNSTAENHCTIYAIAESPKNGSLVWVGTDDGNVQLTRDGGRTWANVVANVPGLPRNTWVSSIDAGHFSEGTAYVTFDGHMTGDMKSYVYKTADYGKSWQPLASPELRGYAHVVKEDLVNPQLLFVGTELGLFVSANGGQDWGQFTSGLPNVAVRDMAIHPRDHDLVLATHGRSLYVIDDITPLRALTPQVLDADAAFLASRPSPMVTPTFEFGFNGDAEFIGQSPGESAFIIYYLKKRHIFGDLKLEVYDSGGKLLSTLQGGKRRGINRVEWPMRSRAPRVAPGAGLIQSLYAMLGPRVLEGTYTVKLIKGKDTYTSEVRLVPDPRSKAAPADRAFQRETALKLYGLVERLAYLVDAIVDARDQLRERAGRLPSGDRLRTQIERQADVMEKERISLVSSKQGEGISGEEKLREELGSLYGNVNGYEGRPTASQINRMGVLGKQLEAAITTFDGTLAKGLADIAPQLAKRKLAPVVKMTADAWEQRQTKK
jgi:photosystem II stability/assembly factor-like uncharacterized protein